MSLMGEELAKLDSLHCERSAITGLAWCESCVDRWPCATRRLISALRAERAEVERLKKIINEYRSRTISYRVDL